MRLAHLQAEARDDLFSPRPATTGRRSSRFVAFVTHELRDVEVDDDIAAAERLRTLSKLLLSGSKKFRSTAGLADGARALLGESAVAAKGAREYPVDAIPRAELALRASTGAVRSALVDLVGADVERPTRADEDKTALFIANIVQAAASMDPSAADAANKLVKDLAVVADAAQFFTGVVSPEEEQGRLMQEAAGDAADVGLKTVGLGANPSHTAVFLQRAADAKRAVPRAKRAAATAAIEAITTGRANPATKGSPTRDEQEVARKLAALRKGYKPGGRPLTRPGPQR